MRVRPAASFALGTLCLWLAAPTQAQFTYRPSGELESPHGDAPRPGAGRVDNHVYAPGMRFPFETGPAYANSQIYGPGGYMGPDGGQCDTRNYTYPWFDNYCEARSWTMPLCPTGQGHQGQDIRPATCEDNRHWAVAATDGTITNIGSYSVWLTADDGTRYDYLHMRSLAVSVGERVERGQRLGLVSDNFGSTATTIHLHFNIRQNVAGVGSVYVPPYMSLVRSYEALIGQGGGTGGYAAEVMTQSFPLASDAPEVAALREIEGVFELRNIGEEPWVPGETFLGTTEPRGGDSPFAHGSWPAAGRAATVHAVVEPGETGRFVTRIRTPRAGGTYSQFFNLVHEAESGPIWFSESSGLPPDDQIQISYVVRPRPCPEDVSDVWSCMPDGRERVRCIDGVLESVACDRCVEATTGDARCESLSEPDRDGDGFGANDDCDDEAPFRYPGATDPCGDGVDADCDGRDPECHVSRDAGSPDAGEPPPDDRRAEGGCGRCTVTRARAWPATWLLALLVWAAFRTRRRAARDTLGARSRH